MFPNSKRTCQPATTWKKGGSGAENGIPVKRPLPCGPVRCLRHPLTRRFPECDSGTIHLGAPWQKVLLENTPTHSRSLLEMTGHEENSRATPTPGENDLRVSPSQPTPWRPASFLPGARPTACGGAPGNVPTSTNPRAARMRTARACLDSPEGRPVFEGLDGCMNVRNGIPRWLPKTHAG